MLDMLRKRAEKAGVAARITLHKCEQHQLLLDAVADFALVFAMLHEVPDRRRLLDELHECVKPGGKLLLAEPPLHVSKKTFANELVIAQEVGFRLVERPKLRWYHAALLERAGG